MAFQFVALIVLVMSAWWSMPVAHASARCGDGKVDPNSELCDDGNVLTGDGCNSRCELETGYICTGMPNICCFAAVAYQYALKGDATLSPTTAEITLTKDAMNQAGVIWFRGTLDFTNRFSVTQRVFLGSNDDTPNSNLHDFGGDGVSVLFQRDPRGIDAMGGVGGGLGASGILPVVGVELDTFNNGADTADITMGDEDHTAIFHTNTLAANELTPTTCLNDGPVCQNFEDGQYHLVQVDWTGAADHHLKVSFDGVPRIDYVGDIIASDFAGDPKGIYFGFAGSTGSSHNLQKICASAPSGFLLPSDFDKDGIDDSVDPDDDNDTLSDFMETHGVFKTDDPGEDHDRDGVPNYRDTDYWRDVVLDATDCPDLIAPIGSCDSYPPSIDADGDGIPAHLDALPEGVRGAAPVPDTDQDGVPDALDVAPDDPCVPILTSPLCKHAHEDSGCQVGSGSPRGTPWLALLFATGLGGAFVRRRRRSGPRF